MQPYVSQLSLYDIANVKGVAADLSHCNTAVQVRGAREGRAQWQRHERSQHAQLRGRCRHAARSLPRQWQL